MTSMTKVADELIAELPDLRAALRACLMFSGKQLKGVAFELGIEGSHLSKMINTTEDPRHFPPEKINLMMDVCGNEIPLRWLMLRRSYPMPHAGQADELARLRRENAELRAEARTIVNVFKTLEVKE